MQILSAAISVMFLVSGPAFALSVAFGDDASQWSNDGECDDPRFEGVGMTNTPLLDADIKHDATDCRTAFEAGTIAIAGGSTDAVPLPVDPGLVIDGIAFGSDTGRYPNDGECDDRRFFGSGMANGLGWENVGQDATDCSARYQAGEIRLWDMTASLAATQCANIAFGDDTGPYPNDSECDDLRFEGPAVALNLRPDAIGKDASDCSRHCIFGTLGMRDY